MDDLCEDFQLYWETNMFFQTEELESWGFDDPALSGSYDSSSPDGVGDTSAASNSKNIVSERNRRKKLNERLFALRAAVPTISKMDKASIVKDAINYIQVLQAEERSVQSDITELERRRLSRVSTTTSTHTSMDFQQEEQGLLLPPSTLTRAKKKKTMMLSCSDMRCRSYCSRGSHCGSLPGIEDIELRFSFVGDNMVAVNLTCSKVAGAMVKLCEIFESLKHKIVTTHISAFGGKLFKTVVVEANGDEIELLKISLETAIANLNNPQNQMSF